MDLSSQKTVRDGAAEVLSWSDVPTIDIVINSAGVALIEERTINDDGIELTFATNHIGHFLFTCLIMPKLIKAAQANPTTAKGATRIINVTSRSPTMAAMRWSDMNFERTNADLPQDEQPNYEMQRAWGIADAERRSYTSIEAYNQSKVANVLFSIALTKRLYDKHGILALAVHPGVIRTELVRHANPGTLQAVADLMKRGVYKYKSLAAGSSTTLVAALDPKLGPGETKDGKENYGVFLADCQISDALRPLAASSAEAERLWELSETLVKETFAW